MGVLTHRHRSVTGGIGRIAYILALIGGVLMVVFGLLLLVGTTILSLGSPLLGLSGAGLAIFWVILGIIAIAGARRVVDVLWAVILIVIGIIAGGTGNIPALLVLLGGILGLIAWII